jgi:hypothetical protein
MAFHYMGTGVGSVGRLEQPDGSYNTTDWVMCLFVPLIPVRSYTVLSEDTSVDGIPLVFAHTKTKMRVRPRPLDWAHVRRVYMVVVPLVAGIVALSRAGGSH